MGHPETSSLIVGRDHDLAELDAAFREVVAGRGRLALIGGEAGIGKTTLIEQFTRGAVAAGATIFTGACYEFESIPPYGPWLEALTSSAQYESDASLLGNERVDGVVADSDELRERAFRFLTEAADHKPVVLILEDMHWADEASIGLLRFFARRLSNHRIMVVASYRHIDLAPESALAHAFPILIRESTPLRITLRALDREDVGRFIDRRYSLNQAARTNLLAYLCANSEGNPLFLVELLRSIEDQDASGPGNDAWTSASIESARVPLVIRQVLERNFARLPESTLPLMHGASVLGMDVKLDEWQALVNCDDDQLSTTIEAAMRVNILIEVPDATALRFRHALIRRTLYEAIPLPRRRTLHRRAAEFLLQSSRPNIDAIAHHLWRANDIRAIEWLNKAGQRANELGAPTSAITGFSRAIDLADATGLDIPVESFKGRAAANAIIGSFVAAVEDYHTVLDHARARKQRYEEWEALLGLGIVWGARDYARSGEYFREALHVAATIDDVSVEARTRAWMGNWHLNVGDARHAIDAHAESLRLYERIGDVTGAARIDAMLAMDHIIRGDMESTAMHARRAASVYRSRNQLHDLPESLALVLSSAGVCSFSTERPSDEYLIDQQSTAEEGISAARSVGWRAGETFARITYATYLVIRGEVDPSEALLGDAHAVAEEIGHREWLALADATSGELALDLKEFDVAGRHLERGWALANEIGSFIHRRIVGDVLARQLAQTGKFSEAETLLSSLLEPNAGMETAVERGCWRARAELWLETGRPETALTIADDLIDASTPADRSPAPHLSVLRGRALAGLRRFDEALDAFDLARNDAERFGYWPLHARICLALADTHTRIGQPEQASIWRQRAIESIDRIGQTIANDDRCERFRKAMIPPDAVQTTSASGLSQREVEVLRLAAKGMTNIQIGNELFISPRTVKGHLESIYIKLDVDSRTAAAAHAYRTGLIQPD